jgi:hypothetical protein
VAGLKILAEMSDSDGLQCKKGLATREHSAEKPGEMSGECMSGE